jgi:chromate transporter
VIGHHVAGVVGAAAATFAMCVPTAVLAYFVARAFDRFKQSAWRNAIQSGLVPVSIGLVAASALILARAADHDWASFLITAATFALSYWTRITPLLALTAAAAAGFAGFL